MSVIRLFLYSDCDILVILHRYMLWHLVLLLGVLLVSPWEPTVRGSAAQTADGKNKSASPRFFNLVPVVLLFLFGDPEGSVLRPLGGSNLGVKKKKTVQLSLLQSTKICRMCVWNFEQ
jgi:hypothetical protein